MPLIFHPYLEQRYGGSKYFLRSNEHCYKLSLIIANSIQTFYDKVKMPGLMRGLINHFGSGLRKSQALLNNRIMRYDFNQANEMQVTQYLRDESTCEVNRLHKEKDAYRYYLSDMKIFLKIKHGVLAIEMPSVNFGMAQSLFLEEVDARNTLISKAIVSKIGWCLTTLSKVYQVTKQHPGLQEQLQRLELSYDRVIESIKAREAAILDQLDMFVDEFSEKFNALLTTLKNYRNFDINGTHLFKSASEKTCCLFAKDAFLQLRAYQMVAAGVSDCYAFAKLEIQTWVATTVKQCCEEICILFEENKGMSHEAYKAISVFVNEHYLFSLEAFREEKSTSSNTIN